MFSTWSLRRRLTLLVLVVTTAVVALVLLITINATASYVGDQTRISLTQINARSADVLNSDLHAVEAQADTLLSLLRTNSGDLLGRFWESATFVMRREDSLITRVGVLRPFRAVSYALTLFREPTMANNPASLQLNVLPDLPDELAPLAELGDREARWFYSPEPYDFVAQPSLIYAHYRADTGYLWVEVPLTKLRPRLQSLSMDDVFHYGVVFADQTQVLGMGGVALPARVDAEAAARDLLTAAAEEYAYMESSPYLNNQSAYVIETPLAVAGWRLIGVVTEEEISNQSDQELLQIGFIVLVGLFGLAWLVDRFSEDSVTRPVSDLTITAQEIGSGDMRYQVGFQERGDEIGGLARALEDMKLNLAHSYESLSMWSRTLEKRVADRTQELQIAQAEALTNAAEIRAVYDASLSVVSEYYLNVVLNTLIERVRDLLRASYCGVWLLTADQRKLEMVANSSDDQGVIGRAISTDEGLAGSVIGSRAPMIVDDYQQWEGRLGWLSPEMMRALAVPLIYSGEPIGAVIAGRPEDALGFSPDEARLLTLLANLVSPVVHSAQLYSRLDAAMRKAESANEVKTRFLASVTHELRTPLNLIINNMDFMRIGAFGEVNEEQKARLDQAVRSAEHLLYLINDLLDVSKIEAGEMQLHFNPADLRPLIEDALDAMLAQMSSKPKVALEVEIPDDLPEVTMDARRIRQVLLNLLSNAVKFTHAGEVRLKVWTEDDRVYMSVKDTGMGIPAAELGQIFEAFRRSKRAKEAGIEGTGLGLPISRHLVEAHGGTMTVESEVGKGSTFTVMLPLVAAPPPTPTLTATLQRQPTG
ncbi:MAG: GAF domain-containing protein [Anaerolinea sp.]|nr:GAF domain-containing protein [Anaerolinea sp.]